MRFLPFYPFSNLSIHAPSLHAQYANSTTRQTFFMKTQVYANFLEHYIVYATTRSKPQQGRCCLAQEHQPLQSKTFEQPRLRSRSKPCREWVQRFPTELRLAITEIIPKSSKTLNYKFTTKISGKAFSLLRSRSLRKVTVHIFGCRLPEMGAIHDLPNIHAV